jgi:hypothetical protein
MQSTEFINVQHSFTSGLETIICLMVGPAAQPVFIAHEVHVNWSSDDYC